MPTWIFQGNPDVFDVDGYLASRDAVLWSVRQRHLAEKMQLGDVVYFWRAAGHTRKPAAIVARGKIVGLPDVMDDDDREGQFWRGGDAMRRGPELRVRLEITDRAKTGHHVLGRATLLQEPGLRDMRVLRFRSETNYLLERAQAARLARLWSATGDNWSRDECIAALWAYAMTFGEPVSRIEGSPVAVVADVTGRGISAVYNKLMNFRHLDPRDTRKGLSSAGAMDRNVWAEFFDPRTVQLHLPRLVMEFERIRRGQGTATGGESLPATRSIRYEGFGPAPPDDPLELEKFARRVRKGQPKFRKVLLAQYEYRCAISGWGPEEVLQAAHIVSHAQTGWNSLDNGLLLRADIHDLFDDGLLRIDPQSLKVSLSPKLAGTGYQELDGRQLRARLDGGFPRSALRQRADSSS